MGYRFASYKTNELWNSKRCIILRTVVLCRWRIRRRALMDHGSWLPISGILNPRPDSNGANQVKTQAPSQRPTFEVQKARNTAIKYNNNSVLWVQKGDINGNFKGNYAQSKGISNFVTAEKLKEKSNECSDNGVIKEGEGMIHDNQLYRSANKVNGHLISQYLEDNGNQHSSSQHLFASISNVVCGRMVGGGSNGEQSPSRTG